ncbi:hypothetical protein [Bradyrhizobium liaoningense]|uniref:hypothetical protein n=1 Tax=Bradyrhizobium liaoningense TaxID=43992 RepID=UPI001BAE1C3D|nr:hypothetical protein [Bradyrhizobium liaoningense]MBR0816678.1 hypothetical protein [Bradyrhizobium liaoningense]
MPRNRESWRASARAIAACLMTIGLLAVAIPSTPSHAQASGQVRVKIVKAGLLIGGGTGTGVLTYRGRDYPFNVSGVSFGITAGATVGRLDGRASGIHEVGDFAGTYSSVGGGAALVGGINGVHLRNEKGVTIVLQGPKAGVEFAANLSTITISMK